MLCLDCRFYLAHLASELIPGWALCPATEWLVWWRFPACGEFESRGKAGIVGIDPSDLAWLASGAILGGGR